MTDLFAAGGSLAGPEQSSIAPDESADRLSSTHALNDARSRSTHAPPWRARECHLSSLPEPIRVIPHIHNHPHHWNATFPRALTGGRRCDGAPVVHSRAGNAARPALTGVSARGARRRRVWRGEANS